MKSRTKIVCSVTSVLACLLSGCVVRDASDVPSHHYLDKAPWVRVLIVEAARDVSIAIPGGTFIVGGSKATLCENQSTMTCAAKKGTVRIAGKNTRYGRVRFVPPQDLHISVAGKEYHGEFTLVAIDDVISVVNWVNVEDYVAGVVKGEMPLSWDDDALCAQVVAARSFALNEKRKCTGKKWFDLYADERSQVYVGFVRDEKALHAASATRGTILVWNWRLFSTYYHSACGGRTKKAYPFLSTEDITPLTGIRCGFCSDVDTTWRKLVPKADLERLPGIPDNIKNLEVHDSPRGRKVKLICESRTITFSADKFRSLVGPRVLRSPAFHAQRSDTGWLFTGRGYGHGSGMCQHGARGMANHGHRWPSILRFYYPGAELVRVY